MTPSELWNNKRDKGNTNTKTPMWCKKCISHPDLMMKNSFLYVRAGLCARMDATLLPLRVHLKRFGLKVKTVSENQPKSLRNNTGTQNTAQVSVS